MNKSLYPSFILKYKQRATPSIDFAISRFWLFIFRHYWNYFGIYVFAPSLSYTHTRLIVLVYFYDFESVLPMPWYWFMFTNQLICQSTKSRLKSIACQCVLQYYLPFIQLANSTDAIVEIEAVTPSKYSTVVATKYKIDR